MSTSRFFVLIILSFLMLLTSCHHLSKNSSSTQIFLVGTAHKKHIESPAYPVANFFTLIQNIRPDLILVEVDNNLLQQGDHNEFLPEMSAIIFFAQQQRIPVFGFDQSLLTYSEETETVPSEILQKRKRINQVAQDFSFLNLNSSELLNELSELRKLEVSHWGQVYPKAAREEALAQNIRAHIQDKNPSRVLVFTGFKHLAELNERLSSDFTFQPVNSFSEAFKKSRPLEPEIKKIWQTHAEQLKEKMQQKNLSPERRNLLQRKLNLINTFLTNPY